MYGNTNSMILSTHGILARSSSATPFSNTKSVEFDAVDDYASTDATYSVLNGLNKMSISLWVKPDNFTLYQILMSTIRNATAHQFQFLVHMSPTAQLRFFTESSSKYTYTNTNALTAGTWNHVLICLDKTQAVNVNRCRIYVNGVDETGGFNNQGTASLYTSTSNLSFGINQNNYFNEYGGKMDEVAIWADLQLSSGDATTLYNSGVPTNLSDFSTPPTNWWRFEEGSGTTISDSIGSADGTLINGTAFSSDVPT
tara:strand:+ start:5936 stop:6700 length:765 start_codon:yes stop_codon:yes gene_type:complete